MFIISGHKLKSFGGTLTAYDLRLSNSVGMEASTLKFLNTKYLYKRRYSNVY